MKIFRCCAEPGINSQLEPLEVASLSEQFALLANPVRLQIIDCLAQSEEPICVCDLETTVSVKQPTVSHHLRLLREAGLIGFEKRGLWVYYFLRREALQELQTRLNEFITTLGVQNSGLGVQE
jgi:ArsR family transcriptional regulator